MKKDYPYLNDKNFQYLADNQQLQNQYVKLTLLDWNENPLEEIQGIATGGTISLNGNSAVRRTCSLNMIVKDVSTGKITDTKNLISINKKLYMEIGIENKTNNYKDYPILWYPQGVFILTQCSISTSLGQGTLLSAQLKDKMCLLNGECGGIITSSVVLDHYETLDDITGSIIIEKPVISMIIKELVNHFGGEALGKIIINDVTNTIKQPLQWTGLNPLYLATKDSSHLFTTNIQEAIDFGGSIQSFNYGQNVGFEFTDFIYPGELIANIGDSVCTILDKIKSTLGNYEYYYDIWGNFIWQEIKNYLNTTQTTIELNNLKNEDYIIDISKGKSVYDFTDNKLAISFSHSPQYNKIKNDYVVWGIKENVTGNKVPIRYHLAIDKKPKTGNIYNVFFYNDPTDGLKKAKCPIVYDNISKFPKVGQEGLFYMSKLTEIIYKWSTDLQTYIALDGSIYAEYNSISDFPNIGQEGVVYLSTSDNKRYCWKLNPNSNHYIIYENQLLELKLNHDMHIMSYQEQIKYKQIAIENYQKEIELIEQECLKWRIQERVLNREITEQQDAKTELENDINENVTQKEYYQNIVDNKTQEIIQLENELAHETDYEKRWILQQKIHNAELEKSSAQQYVIVYQNAIESQVEELEEINKKLSDLETDLAPILIELNPYDQREQILQNQINILKEDIEEIENALQLFENQYEEERINLLAEQHEYVDYIGETLVYVQTTDWRSELYLQGVMAEPLGLKSNYYYPELEAEWPKIYNLQADSYIDSETGHTIYTGAFYDEVLNNPWNVDYWLDFIDSENNISQFNISNIGRRSLTENKDDYNCIFEAEIPDIVIIPNGKDAAKKRQECEDRNQDYCQVDNNIYQALIVGQLYNSCFNEIKTLLWDNTNYNSSINISLIPIYHLEPNSRITVCSIDADIHGDFMMNSISIPLTINGNMNISAVQVQNKL